MHPLLIFITQTSIAGSITALIYLLLYPLLQQIFSAKWQYNIIKMLAVFFVIPVGFAKKAFALWQTSHNTVYMEQFMQPGVMDTTLFAENITQPILQPVLNTLPEVTKTGQIGSILFAIWLAGTLLFTLHQILSYWFFYHKIVQFNTGANTNLEQQIKLCHDIACRMGLRKEISLVINSKIQSPMVFFGVANTIVLPNMPIAENDLQYIIHHELTHIKRRDLLIKFCFLCICALHWFNPLCYLLYRQLNHWCELSCDEAVVKNFSHTEKKEYGLSIINLMQTGKSMDKMLCSSYACSKKNLKRRLTMLIKQNKYIKTKLALSMALTMFIGATGLTASVMAASLNNQSNVPAAVTVGENVTVLETSDTTGIPILIQWNDRQYKIDRDLSWENPLFESSDGGATWQEFKTNYDTAKLLYGSLGIELKTFDEYREDIKELRKHAENQEPGDFIDSVSTLIGFDSALQEAENGEVISHDMVQFFRGIYFEYEQDLRPQITYAGVVNGIGIGSGYNLDILYSNTKRALEMDVEWGYMTQESAERIWKEFLAEFNLAE